MKRFAGAHTAEDSAILRFATEEKTGARAHLALADGFRQMLSNNYVP